MNRYIIATIVAVIVCICIAVYYLYPRNHSGFTFKITPGVTMLDNAASTLPFNEVFDTMRNFSCFYSNIHRGSGLPSLLSTHSYERSKEVVKEFVGATPSEKYFVTYGKNVTEMLNLVESIIAQLFSNGSRKRTVVLLSEMEHTSNDVPFRFLTRIGMNIDYIGLNGADLDYNDLQSKIQKYGNTLNMISITGVSNVTGVRTNIPIITKLAHSVGAWVNIDGAQLVPHGAVNMADLDVEFLGFSAHKIYCPFGIGALIGKIEILHMLVEAPLLRGGGEILFNIPLYPSSGDQQSLNILWKTNDELLEAGTSAVIPAIALMNTLKILQKIGMDKIENYEDNLYSLAYSLFSTLPITVVSPPPESGISSSILSFFTPAYDSALIGAILCFEYGICIRTGCLCAHNYVSKLTGKSSDDLRSLFTQLKSDPKIKLPGVCRISIATYNTEDDIRRCFFAVKNIIVNSKVKYKYTKQSDGYVPEGEGSLDNCICKKYNTLLKGIVED